MDPIVAALFGIEGLIMLAVLIIVIVLIIRRIRIKKQEDFEKRDN